MSSLLQRLPISFALVLSVIALNVSAAQFKFSNQTLTVPDGFEVELVVQSPLVDRPISASFDEQGRLYVTDSSGSNDKPDKQLADKPHRVVRLENTKDDGKFDKTVVFADKMMFPEGCLWYNDSLYVSAPPSIWKLTDTNNDGVADVREEWHQGKTLTGCANDLHGPYLGPDGWIYWCKGAFQKQTYDLPDGTHFESRAAHIFRARPDHSELEPVLTGGMDNPVGVAFTPEGERILCGTFFAPHEPGHRDGLIHAIYGGVYGKINDVTDDHKKTGDLMPVMTHMGPAAPCSVIRYESKVFGDDFRDNLFVCSFNLHKVSRHVLAPDGATFKTKDTDFLTSDNPDFHPTDVIEDADGSLIVLNTGGWYKICCPTSQLSKPDVLGAIYRIRRKGAPRVQDPRGLNLAWGKMSSKELTKLLGDSRPTVVKRAIAQLGTAGKSAIADTAAVLKSGSSPDARRNALWALTQISGEDARKAVREVLHDTNQTLRHAALHSVSVWRDVAAATELLEIVQSSDPQLQRAAAEALGRIKEKRAVPALLAAAARKNDRVLEHSLIYALIEIRDAKATAKGIDADSSFAKRSALIALDQMENGGLTSEMVAPLLGASDPVLRQTASWIAGHHPDWGGALAGFFQRRLEAQQLTDDERGQLSRQLAQFAHSEPIQKIMAETLTKPAALATTKQVVLQAMATVSLKEPPMDWGKATKACLTATDETTLRYAIATAHVLSAAKTNSAGFAEPLLHIGRDAQKPAELRLEALAAIPSGVRSVEPELFTFLCENVEPAKPVMIRNAAVTVLAKARLNQDQLLALTDTIKNAGPLEMTKLLGAFERTTNEAVGLKLVGILKDAKGLSSLRADLLKTLLAKYPLPVQEQSKELITLLNADSAKQGSHIDELVVELKDGDLRRGQLIFNSPKAACASCHTMGYLGGKVGPDLTSIGTVRTERDLLESIIYPSASFVRSYEPYVVTTRAEETFSGVLKKDAADEVVLATGLGAEVRIARADITEMRPGTLSVMPAGLEQQFSKQELADLLAFLKSTKWGPR
jgi:putative membrane-bound dehydrogenase-like protein